MKEKLEEIRIENFTLIIYCILIALYYYANVIEVEYLKYQNELDKEKYRLLLYIVFGTVFILALYYTITGLKNLKTIDNPRIYKLDELLVFVNFLALIIAIIYLYVVYQDRDIDLEVSM